MAHHLKLEFIKPYIFAPDLVGLSYFSVQCTGIIFRIVYLRAWYCTMYSVQD